MWSSKLPLVLLFCSALFLTIDPVFGQDSNGRPEGTRDVPDNYNPPSPPGDPDTNRDSDNNTRDIQHLDDVIIDGSLCVGFDCVNGESFGFETIRLKENNLRIRFFDTSNSASFPTVDWQLTANESSNGGANKFSIEDLDAGRTPFTIEASAPSHSLYVDDGGRIGLGTSTPVVEVHVKDGDTPTVRLEQDGTSGFTPQTWDMAGNETNWFVRDATNGSRLPLRIRPSAPSNSIFVDTDGDVGLGTSSPSASLEINDNVPTLQLEDADGGFTIDLGISSAGALKVNGSTGGGTATTLSLATTGTTGVSTIGFGDDANATAGSVQYIHAIDQLSFATNGQPRMHIASNGDVFVDGGLVHSASDRRLKTDIAPLTDALEKVQALQGVQYRWKDADKPAGLHIGLIAQDVETVVPEVVMTTSDDMQTKMVAYSNLVALLIEAVKDQQAIIDAQRAELTGMQTRMGQFESTLTHMQELLQADAKTTSRSDQERFTGEE